MRVCSLLGVFVMACGGGDDNPPDGAAIDAAPTGPVRVTVRDTLGPKANVRVVFQAADSGLVADATTDAMGQASAMVLDGGFVTVIQPFGAAPRDVRTIAGVKPGDALVFERKIASSGELVTIKFPKDVTAGVDQYAIVTSRASQMFTPTGGGPYTVSTFAAAGDQDVCVVSYGASHPRSAIYFQHATITAGTTVDLSTEPYAAVATSNYRFLSPPLGTQTLELTRQSSAGVGVTDLVITSHQDPAMFDLSLVTVPTIAREVGRLIFTGITNFDVVAWNNGALGEIDLAGQIPALTKIGYDVPSHTYQWTAQSTAMTFTAGSMQVQRSGGGDPWWWSILAPGAPTGVELPVLPGDLAMFNPIATDTLTGNYWVGTTVGVSYDQLRPHGILATPDHGAPKVGPIVLAGGLPASGMTAAQLISF
jgi:hypothetical protein